MSVLTLHVPGMTCRRCVREVSARLRDVAGVQLVTADPTHETVTVVGAVSAAALVAALSGGGYAAHAARRPGED